jgi:phospholipid/cholesterol/gamma-HCH transport system permease protein
MREKKVKRREKPDGHRRDPKDARLDLAASPDSITLLLSGDWRLSHSIPRPDRLGSEIAAHPSIRVVEIDATRLEGWDSGLLAFLREVAAFCARRGLELRLGGLPAGIRRLVTLAASGPDRKDGPLASARERRLARLGAISVNWWSASMEVLGFVGEVTAAFFRMLAGRPRFRGRDFLRLVQECGVDALPIVSLISLLVGLILAFVGAIQLRMFGATIFIANLVGISMARAMGAIMTGIIMAGRTGAAFAAAIGTMQVNEEIDALKTSGIPPIDFLVLPRVLALALMLPLLTLYADAMGMIGGLLVAVIGLDINISEYFNQTTLAVNLTNVCIGVFSGLVFGVLVGLCGCLRGIQCGRSASAVGSATTSAVVSGIVSIIVATAVITVVCDMLRI